MKFVSGEYIWDINLIYTLHDYMIMARRKKVQGIFYRPDGPQRFDVNSLLSVVQGFHHVWKFLSFTQSLGQVQNGGIKHHLFQFIIQREDCCSKWLCIRLQVNRFNKQSYTWVMFMPRCTSLAQVVHGRIFPEHHSFHFISSHLLVYLNVTIYLQLQTFPLVSSCKENSVQLLYCILTVK